MNERIRALAEQAAGNFTENFKWDYLLEIDKDIFEKFAELIVRECIHLCIRELPDPRDTPEGLCAKRIVEHFGLK